MPEKKRRKKTISFAPDGSNLWHDKAVEYFERIKSGDKTDVVAAALIMFFEQNTYYRGNGKHKVTVLPVGGRDVVVKAPDSCLIAKAYEKMNRENKKEIFVEDSDATYRQGGLINNDDSPIKVLQLEDDNAEFVPVTEFGGDIFSDEDLADLVGGWGKKE